MVSFLVIFPMLNNCGRPEFRKEGRVVSQNKKKVIFLAKSITFQIVSTLKEIIE